MNKHPVISDSIVRILQSDRRNKIPLVVVTDQVLVNDKQLYHELVVNAFIPITGYIYRHTVTSHDSRLQYYL